MCVDGLHKKALLGTVSLIVDEDQHVCRERVWAGGEPEVNHSPLLCLKLVGGGERKTPSQGLVASSTETLDYQLSRCSAAWLARGGQTDLESRVVKVEEGGEVGGEEEGLACLVGVGERDGLRSGQSIHSEA